MIGTSSVQWRQASSTCLRRLHRLGEAIHIRYFFIWAAALLLSIGAAQGDPFTYGEIVEVAPNVELVGGRPLDIQKGEVDVANALLYKSGSTLVVIDTGGTAGFIQYLDAAAKRLMPFDRAVLVNTHGHADHVGNNAWIDTLGVPAEHFISAHDLPLMRDQVGYFSDAFDEVGPYIPDAPPGRVFAQQVIDLFGGLDTETKSLTLLESLPLAAIDIGGTSWDGWSLLDGNVLVLRTSGHTAGHVAVYLPGPKVLHLADETTGYYQTFPDADPAANLLTLQRAANAVKNGAVDAVTDGHSFSVHRGDEAVTYLTSLINGSIAYDAAVTRVLNEHADGITIADLVSEVAGAPEMANAPRGANNIPIFKYMQIINKLKELGIAQPTDPSALVVFPH
jgi:glyoxylase-like metal-dependent hydrolase (beta-lactamase superfamily II)